MIIDIHIHQADFRGGRVFHAVKGPGHQPSVETADEILRVARRSGIHRLCLLGRFWAHPSEDGIREINDATMAMVHRHPGRIYGLCFMNPQLDPVFQEAEIDRCVAGGLSGIKLEIEVPARDPVLDPLMKKAAEHDVFVLHHTWYKTIGGNPQESDPSDIAVLASRHPDTKILMAHLTAHNKMGVLDVQNHANVWVDTSGCQPFAGVVEYAVEKLGAERLVYGSDAHGRGYESQLGRIYGADITEQARDLILWRNAARLLKINDIDDRELTV